MLDQVVRYEPVLREVRALGGGTLIDVGSGSVGLAPWLDSAWTVTAVDASFDDYGGASGPADDGVRRMVGDARALPFADGAFDVAVALDLLEHLPPGEARDAASSELCRVARRRTIIACPAGPAAASADRRLAQALRRRGQPPPRWLTEHLDHGFPDPDELRDRLSGYGPVALLGNENARTHELLMRFETRRLGHYASRAAAHALRRSAHGGVSGRALLRAIAWVARGADRPPTYRTLAVVRRDEAPSDR